MSVETAMPNSAAVKRERSPRGTGEGIIREFVRYIPSGDTIPQESWRSRHRNLLLVVVAHVPFLFLLGMFEGTESLVTGATLPSIPITTILVELGIIVLLAAAAAQSRLPRRLRTALGTTALLTCSVVLVHFSGGFIEAHFHFFVGMAVVAVTRTGCRSHSASRTSSSPTAGSG